MRRRAYPVLHGLLGGEDVHPGGAAVSAELVELIGPPFGRAVDLGAGAGGTTRRLRERGWDVLAVEPDPELRGVLQRSGFDARDGRAEVLHEVVGDEVLELVVAESVLYLTDVPRALASIGRALAPYGRLAFVDLVWAAGVAPDVAAAAYDTSVRRFGIPIATRAPWTWDDWRSALDDAGFDLAYERRLGFGTQGHASRVRLRRAVPALLRDPRLAVDVARTAWRTRTDPKLPSEAGESWLCIARKRS